MQRRTVFAWVITAVVACTAQASAASADVLLADRVGAAVRPLVQTRTFSGAVVLMRNGELVYEGGFGLANHRERTAFTPDTPSDGGSLAKTFTAAGVLLLVNEGKIDLDAPVTRYLPAFPHEETRVRHLLSHSNGLPPYYEWFDAHFGANELRTTESMLRVVAQHSPRPTFMPGSRFEYSNLGFDVAAEVIAAVTGQTYGAFLKERFFDRLAMAASFLRPGRLDEWSGVRTQGYRFRNHDWEPFDAFDMEAFYGASNLYFSARDLARWANANALGTALPEAVFRMGQQRPSIAGRPSGITGLSWYCDATGARCYYTGSVNAFHGFAYWDRDRREAVAFLSNSALPLWSTIELQRALVDALAGDASPRPTAPVFVYLDRETIVGRYAGEPMGQVTISRDGKRLRMRIADGLDYDVLAVGDGVFYVPGVDQCLAFSHRAGALTMHINAMFAQAQLARTPFGQPISTPTGQ